MTGKSKCPQCGGPGNHPIGSSACKRIEIQRGDKSKILTEDELEKMLGAGSYWPPWIAEHRNAIRAHDALQRAEIERLRAAARDMSAEERTAYQWALHQSFQSVAAQYARALAGYIRAALDAKEKP